MCEARVSRVSHQSVWEECLKLLKCFFVIVQEGVTSFAWHQNYYFTCPTESLVVHTEYRYITGNREHQEKTRTQKFKIFTVLFPSHIIFFVHRRYYSILNLYFCFTYIKNLLHSIHLILEYSSEPLKLWRKRHTRSSQLLRTYHIKKIQKYLSISLAMIIIRPATRHLVLQGAKTAVRGLATTNQSSAFWTPSNLSPLVSILLLFFIV